MKTRAFSIFLLKASYQPDDALLQEHKLEPVEADNLPQGSQLYVLDAPAFEPWWKGFFGISVDLWQASKGAIVFVPTKTRWFALTFGNVMHNLKQEAYEYDFGLKVTLNSVDKDALKSTDIFEPGSAKRSRIQLPVAADLTLFDFDLDTSVLRSLTGKVKPELAELFKNATGASNLRISAKIEANAISNLCEQLLRIYELEDYKTTFPNIRSVSPVKDPTIIKQLNNKLLSALMEKSDVIALTIPDLVEYRESLFISFSGAGTGLLYDDVEIKSFYSYLDDRGRKLEDLNIDSLKNFRMILVNEDSDDRRPWNLYKCFIFDTSIGHTNSVFHLADGSWYEFDNSYIARMRAILDPYFVADDQMPIYTHQSEGEYNLHAAAQIPLTQCLDTKNISPSGSTAIEPCDLFSLESDFALLRHVKISTRSSQLSHLFNQGLNSVEILRAEPEASKKLRDLLADSGIEFLNSVDRGNYKVRFCIVTSKPGEKKSDLLPLFSRMSLMRVVRALKVMKIEATLSYVSDQSTTKKPKKVKRKKA